MFEAAVPKHARRPSRGRRESGRDTREAIINCAEELLQCRGYSGFAYQHIAVQLGIRNAAIHYHFPSKEDLGIALVQRYRQRFQEWSAELAAELDAWQRLQAYFSIYTDHLEVEGCRLCPGGALAAEFATLPEPMQSEARELARDMHAWLTATLERGRQDGTLQFNGDAFDKAIEIGAALQGGLQIARLSGCERFHQLLDQIALELRQLPSRSCLP